jgi:hypothetical protein
MSETNSSPASPTASTTNYANSCCDRARPRQSGPQERPLTTSGVIPEHWPIRGSSLRCATGLGLADFTQQHDRAVEVSREVDVARSVVGSNDHVPDTDLAETGYVETARKEASLLRCQLPAKKRLIPGNSTRC